MNHQQQRYVAAVEAIDAIEHLSFGELSEHQLDHLYELITAHKEFAGYAERLYDKASKECRERGYELDYDVCHYEMNVVEVASAETLPASSTPRYQFEASYHLYGDGSGGRWVCKRSDNWVEHP